MRRNNAPKEGDVLILVVDRDEARRGRCWWVIEELPTWPLGDLSRRWPTDHAMRKVALETLVAARVAYAG